MNDPASKARAARRDLAVLRRWMAALGALCGLLVAGVAIGAAGVTHVESADGVPLGQLTGRVSAYDADGNMQGALGVLSPQGYFADLLPDGRLGQVLALVYAKPACAGPAAIEVGSVMGGPLPVPGYVFAFGAPARIHAVPAGATARDLAVVSVRERTAEGYRCVARAGRAQVYAVEDNRAEQTGIAARISGPLRLRAQETSASQVATLDHAATMPRVDDETGAGGEVPKGTPQCSAGCYTSYIGDGTCESECANSLCSFDGGDCSKEFVAKARAYEATLCAPACGADNLGDGFCDSACNVSACQFDHGDCAAQ